MENNIENDWIAEAPFLASLRENRHPFLVPDGYFAMLSDDILTSVKAERLKSKIKHDGFSAPPDYFSKLESSIVSRIANNNSRNATEVTTPATLRLWNKQFFKYASAACIIIISAFALYISEPIDRTDKTIYSDIATEQLLFDIDEDLIIDHIESDGVEPEKHVVSDSELETYILNNFSQSDLTL